MAHIIDYSDENKGYIKELNYEWLKKYFEIEPQDEIQLSNPQREIIDKGGHIYYAVENLQIIGTASLMLKEPGTFELGKMAITEQFQGKGLGNLLLQHCIDQAINMGADKIILYSNKRLTAAVNLYRKFGFYEIPLKNSNYKRSDIKMELLL